jgi:ribosomal protein S5
MREILRDAGFADVHFTTHGRTNFPTLISAEVFAIEKMPDNDCPRVVVVEARKA